MNPVVEQILGYARGIWRRRWLVLAVAWLVALTSWIYIYSMENRYQAQARVYVDTQTLLKPLLGGLAIQPNVGQQISMITRTLLSRPNLEKLARMTDLDLRAKTPQQQEALYNGLAAKIVLGGGGENQIYTISYVDASPDLSKRVVQALLTLFTEGSLGGTRTDLTKSQKFIDDQLKQYEDKLLAKEKEMQAFKRRNIAHMPGSEGGFYAQYQQVSAALDQSRQELVEAIDRKQQLSKQLQEQNQTLDSAEPITATTTAIDARIAALQAQVDNLRLQYTDLHPEIARTRKLIARMQEQKQQEAAAVRQGSHEAAKAQNPIYQQLTIAIAQADANVAMLKARAQQLARKKADLYQMVDLVPHVEEEYTQLMRDYGVYQKNFAAMLDRRETASLTSEVETKTDSVDFRVVDPPRVDGKPVWPNRPLLVTLAPMAGLAMGVVLAFLFTQLRPTVNGRRQLQALTDLPLLGAVTMIRTEAMRLRERKSNFTYFVAIGSLLAAYLGQIVYYLLLSPAA